MPKYITNKDGLYLVLDDNVLVNETLMREEGCTFHPDEESMFETVAKMNSLDVSEVEGFGDSVTEDSFGSIHSFDDRGHAHDVEMGGDRDSFDKYLHGNRF